MSIKLFIGIDPGKMGGISVITENLEVIHTQSCPVIKTEFDRFGMVELLTRFTKDSKYSIHHVVLEDIHAVQVSGRTGAFTMGEGKGIWEGILPSLNLRHSLIQPKEWQALVWKGVKKVMVTSSSGKTKVCDTKSTSLLSVKNLFPGLKLTCPTKPRSSIPHDGIVDSLLIAYYASKM